MKRIDNLSSLAGRQVLRRIYNELRFDKQRSSLSTLMIMWKISVFEKQLNKYSASDIAVQMPLGFFRGTALWMEEIVNRYYYSSVNSFVYFGAAILLVLIGLRRFTEDISINLVISGIIFEAVLLLFMFIVMLFSPPDDDTDFEESEYSKAEELLDEIGEIGREFAASVLQMEKITESLLTISEKQDVMIDKLNNISESSADAVRPNPEMIETMKQTNVELNEFRNNLNNLSDTALKIRKEEISYQVRKEIENILTNRINEIK